MERKEFLKRAAGNKGASKKETESAAKPSFVSGKLGKVYGKVFGVIKFILGLCLLPFVYSSTASFLNEFVSIEKSLQNYFWAGVITLVIVYLFVWEPAAIYAKGHQLLELVFSFFQPFVKVAPYLVPIYTLVLFVLYAFLSLFIKEASFTYFAMFLFGLSITLHLIFSSKTIRSKKEDFLKANYIFGSSFIYILNIWLLALGFSLLFNKFSFINFVNVSFQLANDIFKAVFGQLFVPK